MRFAVLSDIHGNIYALEKTILDLKKQKVDRTVFLGDIGFLGLYPQECFSLIEEVGLLINIKGNTDANVEDLDEFTPSNEFEHQLKEMCVFMDKKMTLDAKEKLFKLNISEKTKLEATDFIFCHGSPYSFKDQLTEGNKGKYTDQIISENVNAVICAHTHQPSYFNIGTTQIVNFGAVGYSFNGDTRAQYGIIKIENKRGIEYENRQVNYDIEKYKKEIRNQNPPFRDMLLYALENGKPKPF